MHQAGKCSSCPAETRNAPLEHPIRLLLGRLNRLGRAGAAVQQNDEGRGLGPSNRLAMSHIAGQDRRRAARCALP